MRYGRAGRARRWSARGPVPSAGRSLPSHPPQRARTTRGWEAPLAQAGLAQAGLSLAGMAQAGLAQAGLSLARVGCPLQAIPRCSPQCPCECGSKCIYLRAGALLRDSDEQAAHIRTGVLRAGVLRVEGYPGKEAFVYESID